MNLRMNEWMDENYIEMLRKCQPRSPGSLILPNKVEGIYLSPMKN